MSVNSEQRRYHLLYKGIAFSELDFNCKLLQLTVLFPSIEILNVVPSSCWFSFLLLQDWYHACESYKPNDVPWALQTKAILDRLQLVLLDRSQNYQNKIQPSAQYLGHLLGIEKSVVCYH